MLMKTRPAPSEGTGLHPIENASRDEIEALQLKRLRWSLAQAYSNVPHYRAAFDAAGVHPQDLKSLSDLAKFPCATKETYRQNYPFGLFAVAEGADCPGSMPPAAPPGGRPWSAIRRGISPSGPIASPRSIYAAGGRPGDIAHICLWLWSLHRRHGRPLRRGAVGLHRGCPCPAARPRSRSSSSTISSRTSLW